MVKTALIALIFILTTVLKVNAEEFEISRPDDIATMTMPCWENRQLSIELGKAKFEPVTRGLLVSSHNYGQPMVVTWLQMLTGRGAVTISHPTGEECLAAVLQNVE